ncbi:hypothetical protein DFP73DRAFT_549773 [Morchella snyderi]|nr:hypothetical protein DFP73DRAFT_549773 [Morchella snyderi]
MCCNWGFGFLSCFLAFWLSFWLACVRVLCSYFFPFFSLCSSGSLSLPLYIFYSPSAGCVLSNYTFLLYFILSIHPSIYPSIHPSTDSLPLFLFAFIT